MYRIYRTDDVERVRALSSRLLPHDSWVGDDHAFWIVEDSSGLDIGFASAIYRPQLGYVYLSRSGVDKSASGCGLQRRLIRARVAWARKQGAELVKTYTLMNNYASFLNLAKCGFEFVNPANKYVGEGVFYMELPLE